MESCTVSRIRHHSQKSGRQQLPLKAGLMVHGFDIPQIIVTKAKDNQITQLWVQCLYHVGLITHNKTELKPLI